MKKSLNPLRIPVPLKRFLLQDSIDFFDNFFYKTELRRVKRNALNVKRWIHFSLALFFREIKITRRLFRLFTTN